MTIFLYYHDSQLAGDLLIRQSLIGYLEKGDRESCQILEETGPLRIDWKKRVLGKLLETLSPNPVISPNNSVTLVVYDALELARSTAQILDILVSMLQKGVNVHFVKYKKQFLAIKQNRLEDLLKLAYIIDKDFSDRVFDNILPHRKAYGMPLGRPKGSKNKALKLDRYQQEIKKYLSLGISKASIAKLVGCHPQTLYDWLNRKDIGFDIDDLGEMPDYSGNMLGDSSLQQEDMED